MKRTAFHPIIYVRGYAMTQNEIEQTVADPYMGFNVGSAKLRQLWDGRVKKYFFESPLVRLLKQHQYDDVYEEGYDRISDLTAPSTIDGRVPAVPYRSIVIYRYYEPSSEDLGTGVRPDIRQFADGLGDLILKLRERVYPDGASTVITAEEQAAGKLPFDRFRVHLVAHSMGGLVCRAFLQNSNSRNDEARRLVDKLFTYATPHNGIEIGLLGNVPKWLALYGMNTFNRSEIAQVLGLSAADLDGENVDIVTNFDAGRVFNLVGTNCRDYDAGAGLSSAAVGEASDGLVRIKNSTTRARAGSGFVYSPHAFVHRSHSGFFGIVNSEEGYQNLTRFLFGDVRADGTLLIDELTVPPAVQEKLDEGRDVRASYHFEVAVSLRGKPWYLHRRTTDEHSAIFRQFDELFDWDGTHDRWVPKPAASPVLFNVFLDMDQSQTRTSLSFAADLCVRSPGYEVDKLLFLKDHYEGGYLYRDTVLLEATPPAQATDAWKFEYWFGSRHDSLRRDAPIVEQTDDSLTFEIPIVQPEPPGIRARLRVRTSYWNGWQ